MGAKRIEDLVTYQFAVEFRDEVQRLLRDSPTGARDFRFAAQLRDSASGVASTVTEGFHRRRPAEFAQFLRYSGASLAEARNWIQDGIGRGHWTAQDAGTALAWHDRCRQAIEALRASQARRARERRPQAEKPHRAPPRTDRQ